MTVTMRRGMTLLVSLAVALIMSLASAAPAEAHGNVLNIGRGTGGCVGVTSISGYTHYACPGEKWTSINYVWHNSSAFRVVGVGTSVCWRAGSVVHVVGDKQVYTVSAC